jgi:hypothetical protein
MPKKLQIWGLRPNKLLTHHNKQLFAGRQNAKMTKCPEAVFLVVCDPSMNKL